MSLKVIQEQILHFISQSTPSVMAIKGEWGVGKTFGWEKFLAEAKRDNMISAKRYSYISLFGISSLDKLKYSIFENSIPKESIGQEPSLESLRSNSLGMLEVLGRGSWSKFKELPFIKSAAPAVEAFSFMSVSEALICIDDLERKGTSLDLKDVLGLVSLLKEKKKCKVILLLNAGTDETEAYEKYKEKVIDIELDFNPTAEESAKVAYDGRKAYHAELTEFTVSLEIKNIRVLKKIEKFIDMAIVFFDRVDKKLMTQLIHTITLFSWANFCSANDENIPTLDFIESLDTEFYLGMDNLNEQEKLWKNVLLSYNFNHVDALDRSLAGLVRNGYLDGDKFRDVVSESNRQAMINNNNQSYDRAWSVFHHSFSDDQETVVNQLYDAFKLNYPHVSPNNLDGLVHIFRELGEDQKASEAIDIYIEGRKEEVELFNPNSNEFMRPIEDEEILRRFRDAYDVVKPVKTIRNVLERIAGRNGWNNEDEEVLSSASEQDYYEYFKTLNGPNLSSHISTCLKFGRIGNANERMLIIEKKARAALEKIASESKLNKLRMRKFGV